MTASTALVAFLVLVVLVDLVVLVSLGARSRGAYRRGYVAMAARHHAALAGLDRVQHEMCREIADHSGRLAFIATLDRGGTDE